MIEQRISVSQFAELLGLEPATLRFVTFGAGRDSSVSVWLATNEESDGPPWSTMGTLVVDPQHARRIHESIDPRHTRRVRESMDPHHERRIRSEDDMTQTSGVFPQLGKKSPKGKGGKKGC